MLINAQKLPAGHRIDADLCIIGGGAAGITLASRFDGSALTVCLLESGALEFDPVPQALCEGEYVGEVPSLDARYLTDSRRRVFGGTTSIWAGYVRPLEVIDFEKRDWVPESGWPFGYAHLEPYYNAASDFLGIGRFDQDNPDTGRAPSLFEGPDCRERVFRFAPKRFGPEHSGRLRESGNITVFLNASATELVPTSGGKAVASLRAGSPAGARITVRARQWVLAAGGIENARLLLVSGGQDGRGLGNDRDLVGRYFMEHSFIPWGLGPVFIWGRHAMDLYRFHNESDPRALFVFSSEDLMRRERLLNVSMSLENPATPEMFSSFDRALIQASGPVDSERLDDESYAPPQAHRLTFLCETAPNRNSRVTLGNRRDALGMPRVVLDWRLSGREVETIHIYADVMSRRIAERGLGRMKVEPSLDRLLGLLSRDAHHHMGTTRMNDDPSKGVVDADGRVHGLRNLWVAGSSVFPTSGAANPTFTIVALALRLADRLRTELT